MTLRDEGALRVRVTCVWATDYRKCAQDYEDAMWQVRREARVQ